MNEVRQGAWPTAEYPVTALKAEMAAFKELLKK
jgi:hypothetical protein